MNRHTSTNTFLTTAHAIVHAILLVLLFSTALQGQGGAMGNFDLSGKMAENAKKFKQYTYTQKTEIFLKGELKGSKLARVHYDPTTGEKIVTPLDSEPAHAQRQSVGRRGMLARVKEKKIEEKRDEMKEYVERLASLMSQYLPPNPDRISALPHAEITPPASGALKIALPDYLKQGDKLVLSVDPSTKTLSEVLVNSSLDNDPVTFEVNFSQLSDGTNYPSLTNINSPAKDLRIQVSTSDYHK